MQDTRLFFQALLTYIVVDVAYQLVVGFRLMSYFVETSPLKDAYVQPTGVGAALMLLFFSLLAFANLRRRPLRSGWHPVAGDRSEVGGTLWQTAPCG